MPVASPRLSGTESTSRVEHTAGALNSTKIIDEGHCAEPRRGHVGGLHALITILDFGQAVSLTVLLEVTEVKPHRGHVGGLHPDAVLDHHPQLARRGQRRVVQPRHEWHRDVRIAYMGRHLIGVALHQLRRQSGGRGLGVSGWYGEDVEPGAREEGQRGGWLKLPVHGGSSSDGALIVSALAWVRLTSTPRSSCSASLVNWKP